MSEGEVKPDIVEITTENAQIKVKDTFGDKSPAKINVVSSVAGENSPAKSIVDEISLMKDSEIEFAIERTAQNVAKMAHNLPDKGQKLNNYLKRLNDEFKRRHLRFSPKAVDQCPRRTKRKKSIEDSSSHASGGDYISRMTDAEIEFGITRTAQNIEKVARILPDKGEKLKTCLKRLEDELKRRQLCCSRKAGDQCPERKRRKKSIKDSSSHASGGDDISRMADSEIESVIQRAPRIVAQWAHILPDKGDKVKSYLKRLKDELERRKLCCSQKDDHGCKKPTHSGSTSLVGLDISHVPDLHPMSKRAMIEGHISKHFMPCTTTEGDVGGQKKVEVGQKHLNKKMVEPYLCDTTIFIKPKVVVPLDIVHSYEQVQQQFDTCKAVAQSNQRILDEMTRQVTDLQVAMSNQRNNYDVVNRALNCQVEYSEKLNARCNNHMTAEFQMEEGRDRAKEKTEDANKAFLKAQEHVKEARLDFQEKVSSADEAPARSEQAAEVAQLKISQWEVELSKLRFENGKYKERFTTFHRDYSNLNAKYMSLKAWVKDHVQHLNGYTTQAIKRFTKSEVMEETGWEKATAAAAKDAHGIELLSVAAYILLMEQSEREMAGNLMTPPYEKGDSGEDEMNEVAEEEEKANEEAKVVQLEAAFEQFGNPLREPNDDILVTLTEEEEIVPPLSSGLINVHRVG